MFSFENYPNLLPFQFQGWQTDIFLSSYLLYSLAPVPLWSATLPPTSVASSTSKTASTPSHLLLWAQVFPVPESKPCVFHRTFQSCVELDLQQIGFYYILCLLYSIYLLFILYLLYSIIQTLCAIFQNAKSTQSCLDLSFWMAFNSASAPIDIQQSLSVWFEFKNLISFKASLKDVLSNFARQHNFPFDFQRILFFGLVIDLLSSRLHMVLRFHGSI